VRESIHPVALSMVLSEGLWRNPSTGNWTCLEAFNVLRVPTLPGVVESLCVYAAFADVFGGTEVRFSLFRVAPDSLAEELLARTPVLRVRPGGRRRHLVMGTRMRELRFGGPGEYRLAAESGGTCIMDRKFLVLGRR
jgi:hypothetical protein